LVARLGAISYVCFRFVFRDGPINPFLDGSAAVLVLLITYKRIASEHSLKSWSGQCCALKEGGDSRRQFCIHGFGFLWVWRHSVVVLRKMCGHSRSTQDVNQKTKAHPEASGQRRNEPAKKKHDWRSRNNIGLKE
jgi:hypothetical protein